VPRVYEGFFVNVYKFGRKDIHTESDPLCSVENTASNVSEDGAGNTNQRVFIPLVFMIRKRKIRERNEYVNSETRSLAGTPRGLEDYVHDRVIPVKLTLYALDF
jgi:hypothetical protein